LKQAEINDDGENVLDQQIAELKAGETIDRLGYQGLRIIQNPSKFKFTMDAFLLAGFINPKPAHKIIDLGSGGGVLSLLIAGQKEVTSVLGIEIQSELVEMARRSVILNKLENKVNIELGDVRDVPPSLRLNSFDYVITNPPFFPLNKGQVSEKTSLALAKFEINCTLEDIVQAASRNVKANGKVAMIYPTERLNILIMTLNTYHLTPKKICFIHPKLATKSNLALVEARPNAKDGVEVLPPIVIYDEAEMYTKTMDLFFHGANYQNIFP
jgi:tRNA1(Val) A37 N6-methylase TrmN6